MEEMTILDKLLDEENIENIVLPLADGTECEMEQIALIPIEDKMYAILKPVTPMAGIAEDEATIVYVDADQQTITNVTDTKIIDAAFVEYTRLYNEYLEENGEDAE